MMNDKKETMRCYNYRNASNFAWECRGKGSKNDHKSTKTGDNERNEGLDFVKICTVDYGRRSPKVMSIQRNDHMIIDNGISELVLDDRDLIQSIHEVEGVTVEFENGRKVKSKYQIKISVRLATLDVFLSSIFYIPELKMNTLSSSRLNEKKIITIFFRNVTGQIYRDGINRFIDKIDWAVWDGLHVVDIMRHTEVLKQRPSMSTTNRQPEKGVSKLNTFRMLHITMGHSNQFIIV